MLVESRSLITLIADMHALCFVAERTLQYFLHTGRLKLVRPITRLVCALPQPLHLMVWEIETSSIPGCNISTSTTCTSLRGYRCYHTVHRTAAFVIRLSSGSVKVGPCSRAKRSTGSRALVVVSCRWISYTIMPACVDLNSLAKNERHNQPHDNHRTSILRYACYKQIKYFSRSKHTQSGLMKLLSSAQSVDRQLPPCYCGKVNLLRQNELLSSRTGHPRHVQSGLR